MLYNRFKVSGRDKSFILVIPKKETLVEGLREAFDDEEIFFHHGFGTSIDPKVFCSPNNGKNIYVTKEDL